MRLILAAPMRHRAARAETKPGVMSPDKQLAEANRKWQANLRMAKILPRFYFVLFILSIIAVFLVASQLGRNKRDKVTLFTAGSAVVIVAEAWIMNLHVGRLWAKRGPLAVEWTNAHLQVLAEQLKLAYRPSPSGNKGYGRIIGKTNGIDYWYGFAELPPCRDVYWGWSLSFDVQFPDLSLGILRIPFYDDGTGNPFAYLSKMRRIASTSAEFDQRFGIHSNKDMTLPPQVLEACLMLSNNFILLEMSGDKCRFIFGRVSSAEDLTRSLKVFQEIYAWRTMQSL